jgi:hypothetical protein
MLYADHRNTYELALVSASGSIVARVKPTQQWQPSPQLAAGDKIPTFLIPYSSSSSRLYYLDGNILRSVTPGGVGGVIRMLEAGNREYALAVTADDRRIAVAEFDYSMSPPAFHVWVEDLAGGNRVDLKPKNISYGWPFGWLDGKLIVVEAEPYDTVSVGGLWRWLPFPRKAHLIDPYSGAEIATLCSWPVAGHALCPDAAHNLYINSWDGSRVPQPQVGRGDCYPTGALSPDGLSIAGWDFIPGSQNCESTGSILITDSKGRRQKVSATQANPAFPEAYLDATHLIYTTPTGQFEEYDMNIVDLSAGRAQLIDFGGVGIHAFGQLPPLES